MNAKHFDILEAVMQRVIDSDDHKFDIRHWLNPDPSTDKYPRTETKAVECGSAACVVGWLALSPQGKAKGWSVGRDGYPTFKAHKGAEDALGEFLGIDWRDAYRIAYPSQYKEDPVTAETALARIREVRAEYEAKGAAA